MAKNPNPELPNRHCFVAAKTGGGKSQLMRGKLIPAKGVRAVFWDPDEDHDCEPYDNRLAFIAALKRRMASGKAFRIGWVGDDSQDTFAWWAAVVWAALDGNRPIWVICEEMADLQMGQVMLPYLRKLMVRGRKYGAILVLTTQRCQEVPKALITQPAHRFLGLHEDQDARYLERATGVKAEILEGLKPLHFVHKGPDGQRLTNVKYKKFTRRQRALNAA